MDKATQCKHNRQEARAIQLPFRLQGIQKAADRAEAERQAEARRRADKVAQATPEATVTTPKPALKTDP